MKLIKEIFEKEIISNDNPQKRITYSVRKAARALLFKDNHVAILFVSKNNYHKLPGGGVEHEENIEEALHREILEETGCTAEIREPLGITIQYKDTPGILQIDYIFSAQVLTESKEFNFTKKETAEGFMLKWCAVESVNELFKKDIPKDYHGKFISVRDSAIIEYFQNQRIPN